LTFDIFQRGGRQSWHVALMFVLVSHSAMLSLI